MFMSISKKQTPQKAAHFKIKFSKIIFILAIAVLVVCAIGIGVSVWRIVDMGIKGFTDALKYPFFIVICVFCAVTVTCILCDSRYIVENKTLVAKYGFIKSKYEIKNITSIVQNTEEKKLTLYFGEQFMLINISPEWLEKFVRALLDANPDIDYSFTLSDNVPPEEEK